MAQIIYLTGDATEPVGDGPKIIAHICNDYGGWGRGFVLALSAKDRRPENTYRARIHQNVAPLGDVYMAPFDPTGQGRITVDLLVANMVAQHGNSTPETPVAVDYKALWECLCTVGEKASALGSSVHMPRIGTGLGGGDWAVIEDLIVRSLVEIHGVDVYVYNLA